MKQQFYILIILSFGIISCQDVNSLVNSIAKANVVECETVGFAGRSSEVYSNFRKLKRRASKSELIELLSHDSLAIVGYSSYALIDKELIDPANLLAKFINSEDYVPTFCGCIVSGKTLSSLIYQRYWNTRIEFPNENDFENMILNDSEDLRKMDSLILYSTNPDWYLVSIALENRIYSDEHHDKIEEWAFVKNNFHALKYVYENLKKGNEKIIIESINDYVNNVSNHEAQKRELLQMKSDIQKSY